LPSAIAAIESVKPILSGLLVDYHLDNGNGIDAIVEIRKRFGADLPAILITADRTPPVRDEARARDVPIVNKPVKPAALRALLAQWRIQQRRPLRSRLTLRPADRPAGQADTCRDFHTQYRSSPDGCRRC
jgi:CheY-like chemotaxis protein